VDLLAELYDHLGPALHDAPWLDAVAPGPGGLTPDEEGMTGLPIPLRQALQSGLERSAGIGSGRLRSSGDADGGASHDHRESARQSKAEAQEVARAFIEEFENTAATLLSGAEKARLAKLRRARHAAALEIQRSSRGWLARQPDQPWAESYRLQTKAAMRIQSIYRGWAYRTLVWSAAVAAAPAPPTVGGGSSPAPAEQQQPQLTRRQRVEQKEEMENAQLQLQADRYNVRWEETFAQFVEKFGDSNKYKKFVLKDECHKRGLEDDGDSAALASRLSEYEADGAMSAESGVWEHERAVEQAKKNAYENASVKLKMKRLVEESGRDVERQEEKRKAEAELLTREVSRVNKLLKAQARKHKQTVQQDPTAAAAAAAPAAAGGGGGGEGGSSSSSSSSAAQQGQQGQAQELTFEDLQRFKKTFELFKSLPANQLPPPPPVPLAGAGTGANDEDEDEESGPSGSGSSSSSSTTMSGYRAGIAMRYLGSNPTEAELQELLRESGVAVAAAAAGTAVGTAAGAQRVDFSGFVTMMARKMTSTRKSEAELLAAFALFAAAATTTGTAAETGAAAGDGAGGTSPSSAQQEQRQEQQQVQRVISAAELRHILQNTGERMRPDEVDRILTIAIPPAAAAPAAATTAAAVDYAQLAKELLRG
jgi:Ca2+-binding EF-hand superfamily protein